MVNSGSYYRPSVLELAQAGNFQAIAYWMNSLLAAQGLSVQATGGRGSLKLIVFPDPALPPRDPNGRDRLVRFICYRLWTLNSDAIRTVHIVARQPGATTILWQQTVRISKPAPQTRSPQRRSPPFQSAMFQIVRSLWFSRVTIAGFFLCYWLICWELRGQPTDDRAIDPSGSAIVLSTNESAKGQLRVADDPNLAQPKMRYPELPPAITVPPAFRGEIVRQVSLSQSEKVVALTFDGGPWPGNTDRVLEILHQQAIHATFFWLGRSLQQHPDLGQRVVAAGHAIGHTWSHATAPPTAADLRRMAKLMYQTTGVRTALLRPPTGELAGALVPMAQRQNYTIALWSTDSHDSYTSAPLIVDTVLKTVQAGGIVLLHDGGDRTATIQALPQIIDTLKRQGYRFVTVPELLDLRSRQTPPSDRRVGQPSRRFP